MPLSGFTVVTIEQAVAAPLATRHLADLGARVIKVERPDGGDFARGYDDSVSGQSSYFVWLNTGKESLALDLKTPRGVEVVHRLIETADVFVQNLGPGAAARLGLGSDELRARHDRLVTCDISGYGQEGPWAGRKAYDLLVQCETGLVSITGAAGSPAKVGISIADIAAGMYAYSGILAALLERSRTGRGCAVQVSLLDALLEWLGQPAVMAAATGHGPVPQGLSHATIAPYGPFPTLDGTVVIAVQNEREFRRFVLDVLEQPELDGDERFQSNADRVRHRSHLDAVIADVTSAMTSDVLVSRLDDAGIANGRLRDVSELVVHPQIVARGLWHTVTTPAGPARVLVGGATFSGRQRERGAVPAVGQHSTRILAEKGLTEREIDELLRDAVVGAPQ